MSIRLQLLAVIACFCLLLATIELIRRRDLEEKYAILWLLTAIFLLICSSYFRTIEWASDLVGALVPSNFLFILALLFLVIISLSLTVVVSKESLKNRKMSQQLALLRFTIEEIRTKPVVGGANLTADITGSEAAGPPPTKKGNSSTL